MTRQMQLLIVGMLVALPGFTAWLSTPPVVKKLVARLKSGGAGSAKTNDIAADSRSKSSSPLMDRTPSATTLGGSPSPRSIPTMSSVTSATALGGPPSPQPVVTPVSVPTSTAAAVTASVLLLTLAESNFIHDPLFHDAVWLAKMSTAMLSAWVALSLKQAGLDANPDRRNGKIKCPWPFVLAALPWTDLGLRSLKTGLRDWQTWVAVSLMLLYI
eukprot:TRINITY_DN89676_c0_g1_i1.p1 TRINITY_DN89676_c0_g1~~TRINITY_DN89676_c0_g1_i1.p1  ORF type:complete len:215 (+),score=23.54 TRINITY_DN89676_c0_g1_i1:41-685(+)